MKNTITLVALFLSFFHPFSSTAQSFSTGDMAIIGFNSDSTDYLAVATFVPIPANTTLYIRDDEWNGTAFTTGEGTLSWNSGSQAIAAGTVILFNALADTIKLSASVGTITKNSTTAFNLSGSDEGVFIYAGTNANTPTVFIAALFNGAIAASATTLVGTNMSAGASAVVLTAGIDIGAYKGSRKDLDKNAFLTEINNMSNWDLQDGTGNQSTDGTAPDLPFSTAPFTISANDVTPPSVTSVSVLSKTNLRVFLTEKTTKVAAEAVSNYVFSPNITVAIAAYDSVNLSVTLGVMGWVSGTNYTLSVNNLKDNTGNTQTKAATFKDLYYNDYAGNDLVITEIMYNLGTGDSLEFIEIYNKGTAAIPLGGMRLVGVTGTLSEYSLPAKGIAVLAADSGACARWYGLSPTYDWAGEFLNNAGELVGLRNSLGALVDSVLYDDANGWAVEADGKGTSLEIIDPEKDNSVATNWRASKSATGKKVGNVDVFCSPGKLPAPTPVNEVQKELDFIVFPTVVTENTLQFSRELRGIIVDRVGRVVLKFDKTKQVNVAALQSGLYVVNTEFGSRKFVVQR